MSSIYLLLFSCIFRWKWSSSLWFHLEMLWRSQNGRWTRNFLLQWCYHQHYSLTVLRQCHSWQKRRWLASDSVTLVFLVFFFFLMVILPGEGGGVTFIEVWTVTTKKKLWKKGSFWGIGTECAFANKLSKCQKLGGKKGT